MSTIPLAEQQEKEKWEHDHDRMMRMRPPMLRHPGIYERISDWMKYGYLGREMVEKQAEGKTYREIFKEVWDEPDC